MGKKKKKSSLRMFSRSCYKPHLLGDYAKTIRLLGTSDGYSTQWTSPPLSFVSPMQDVGKQFFTTLANVPHILFSRPRTESTIQFGMSYKASIQPSLSLCIQDLMDGLSEGLATPINCIFGIQAPHVQAKDIFASIITATDRADWGDRRTLLCALDIPFTANGLGKCQLDANPYDSDN